MGGVNKVILLGNVGTEPEVRHLDNGRSVANLSLATNRVYKNQAGERVENTDWHKLVFWSPLATIVEKYVKKGSRLYVEGRITTRSYLDKDENRRYITEIEVREMQMIDKRTETNQEEEQDFNQKTEGNSTPIQKDQSEKGQAEEEEDDLPF
ncbi:MAG: single-stranded DNA-binding protein [Cytophagales bacterium]|nr:single-stranded DNA-binding protein [Cytophagales bacterium]